MNNSEVGPKYPPGRNGPIGQQILGNERLWHVAKQLEKTNQELNEMSKILSFLKSSWFPKQPLMVRVWAFLITTGIVGIILSVLADGFEKFILHW